MEDGVGRGQCHAEVAQPLRWRLCQENTAQKLRCAHALLTPRSQAHSHAADQGRAAGFSRICLNKTAAAAV